MMYLMQQNLITEQIVFLAVLVLIGVLASRLGVIKSETRDALARIIFNITLPLMLFTNFSKLELTPVILRNSLVVICLSMAAMLLMLGAGAATSRMFRAGRDQRSVYTIHNSFGNIIYFGFPIVTSLFGELGLFYASIYAFVSIMLLWTLGVYIITRNSGRGLRQNLRQMVNPNSVAILAGFLLFLLRIKIPHFLLEPFRSLGATTIYLSMLYIGALLGLMKIREILASKMVLVTTLNKNFLFPMLLILVFALARNTLFSGVDNLVLAVVVIEAAMPCMANIVIVARMFNADERLATSNVFLSTIVSILSLPLVYIVLDMLILN